VECDVVKFVRDVPTFRESALLQCLGYIAADPKMDGALFNETLISVCQTARRHNPELRNADPTYIYAYAKPLIAVTNVFHHSVI
jgi:hypothetical protein